MSPHSHRRSPSVLSSGFGPGSSWLDTANSSPIGARDWLWVALIGLLALSVRMAVIWQLSENNPGFHLPTVDSLWHYRWGQTLADGHWLGDTVFYRAPLYPYLLGAWITFFGDGLWGIRLAQAAIGSVSALLVCLVGWRAWGRRVGVTAGLAWALYGPMIFYETELLIPVLVIPLNLLAILMSMRAAGEPERRRSWLIVGLILGISAIARPNILLTVPAFWLWSWMKRDRSQIVPRRWINPLVLTLGVLIPIAPVTVRNAVVGNDAVLISYQGGVNLYLGNNPHADGLTMQMPDVKLDESIPWTRFVAVTDSVAAAQAGRPLRPSEVSAHWTGKALTYMTQNPGETIERWVRKAYYLLNGFEVGDQTNIYGFTEYSSLLGLLIRKGTVYLPFGLVGALALLALPLAWSGRLRTRPLLVFAVLYALTIIPFLATARHRLPLAVVMVIFAAAGLWQLLALWRERRWLRAIVSTAVGLLVVIALNRPAVEAIMRNPAFNLYQQALTYDRRGDYYEAIELYEEALREEPKHLASLRYLAYDLVRIHEHDSAIAVSMNFFRIEQNDSKMMTNMGLAYLGLGDTARARGAYRIASKYDVTLAQPRFNLGEIALARGKIDEAIKYLEDAIIADSTYPPPYQTLAAIYAQGGDFRNGETLLRIVLRQRPDHGTTWANLGAILLEAGKSEEAIEALRRASVLLPETVEIRLNLAIAYVRNEDIESCVAELKSILKTAPGNTAAQEFLDRLEAAHESIHSPGQ